MGIEQPKFTPGEGLSGEEAKKATKRLESQIRERAIEETESGINESLSAKGDRALEEAISALRDAGFSKEEIGGLIEKKLNNTLNH